jgi:hypothetical protein
MKPTLRPVLTLALLALALAPFAAPLRAAAEKTHTVNLSPAWKVGEKYGYTNAVTMSMNITVSAAPPGQPFQPVQQQAQRRIARIEADAEVLAVFPHGGLQKAAFTIKKFTGTSGEAAVTDLLPAGAKLVAEKKGDADIFTVDGKPATPDLLDLLKLAIELDRAIGNDQDVVGPKAPVAVGGTWPVNGALFVEPMKAQFGSALAAKGTMKLDAISGDGAAQIASVSGAITFDNIQAPFPPPFVTKSAEMKVELSGTQPAAHKGTRTQGMTMTVKLTSEGSDGGVQLKAAMDVAAQSKSEITYR